MKDESCGMEETGTIIDCTHDSRAPKVGHKHESVSAKSKGSEDDFITFNEMVHHAIKDMEVNENHVKFLYKEGGDEDTITSVVTDHESDDDLEELMDLSE